MNSAYRYSINLSTKGYTFYKLKFQLILHLIFTNIINIYFQCFTYAITFLSEILFKN